MPNILRADRVAVSADGLERREAIRCGESQTSRSHLGGRVSNGEGLVTTMLTHAEICNVYAVYVYLVRLDNVIEQC